MFTAEAWHAGQSLGHVRDPMVMSTSWPLREAAPTWVRGLMMPLSPSTSSLKSCTGREENPQLPALNAVISTKQDLSALLDILS